MKRPSPSPELRRILLETGLVVLGVVLALAANEWRRAYTERQAAALALVSIRDELRANHEAVLESERYHRTLFDSLMAWQQRRAAAPNPTGAARPDPRLFGSGFTRPASLLHTAWDAAGAADAVRHMAYGDVLLLARIYEEQQEYRLQAQQIGQLIYGRLFDQGYDGMLANAGNLTSLIGTFWYRECQLLHRYADALPQLSGATAEPTGAAAPLPERCLEVPAR